MQLRVAGLAIGALGAVLLVIGALLPWITVLDQSPNGLDLEDGWLTVGLGVAALVILLLITIFGRTGRWMALIGGFLVLAMSVLNSFAAVRDMDLGAADLLLGASVAYGLYVVLIGGILMGLGSLVLLVLGAKGSRGRTASSSWPWWKA